MITHKQDCAMATTTHLTCTCGALLIRQLDDGPDNVPQEVAEMLARGSAGNFTQEGQV